MLSQATASPTAPSENTPKPQQSLTAILAILASFALGIVGMLFFYNLPTGLNQFIYVLLFIVASYGLIRHADALLISPNAIFAITALIFTFFLLVHTVTELMMLNTLLVMGSLLAFTCYITTPQLLGGHWLSPPLRFLESGLFGWLTGPLTILQEAAKRLSRDKINDRQWSVIKAVLRGLFIAAPIFIVFLVLFSSADAIFADYLHEFFGWLDVATMDEVFNRAFFSLILTWGFLTAFGIMLFNALTAYTPTITTKETPLNGFLKLGFIEAGIILGSINLLFLAFVLIQARYLFGGEANITAQGYTYAEYARQGFFELLAVSGITIVLVIVIDSITNHTTHKPYITALLVVLIALTGVILIAAWRRLNLYEDAYGFTRIRVMSKFFMVWLAILLGILLLAILRHQHTLFWLGGIGVMIAYVLTLNVVNLDAYIAAHNIERFADTGKIDIIHLVNLSDDAIPTIAPLLDSDTLTPSDKNILRRNLGERLYLLDEDRAERSWLSYHVGKDRAWQALDDYREALRDYIFPPRYDGSYVP